MNCAAIRELAALAAGDDLDAVEASALAEHLRACARCAEDARSLAAARGAVLRIAAGSRHASSPGLRVATGRRRNFTSRPLVRVALVLLLGVALFAIPDRASAPHLDPALELPVEPEPAGPPLYRLTLTAAGERRERIGTLPPPRAVCTATIQPARPPEPSRRGTSSPAPPRAVAAQPRAPSASPSRWLVAADSARALLPPSAAGSRGLPTLHLERHPRAAAWLLTEVP